MGDQVAREDPAVQAGGVQEELGEILEQKHLSPARLPLRVQVLELPLSGRLVADAVACQCGIPWIDGTHFPQPNGSVKAVVPSGYTGNSLSCSQALRRCKRCKLSAGTACAAAFQSYR